MSAHQLEQFSLSFCTMAGLFNGLSLQDHIVLISKLVVFNLGSQTFGAKGEGKEALDLNGNGQAQAE